MAKFTVQLDRKKKLQNGLYNLVVRVNMGNDMIYLNFSKLTENHYDHVFVKKYGDEDSIAFREKCEGFRTKWERTYNKVHYGAWAGEIVRRMQKLVCGIFNSHILNK
jgi:hypothetical protein